MIRKYWMKKTGRWPNSSPEFQTWLDGNDGVTKLLRSSTNGRFEEAHGIAVTWAFLRTDNKYGNMDDHLHRFHLTGICHTRMHCRIAVLFSIISNTQNPDR